MAEAGTKADVCCPYCSTERLFGPSAIVDELGLEHRYYSCPCCHHLVLEDRVTGELIARSGAW